jgi:hypothetical protein
MTFVHSGDYGDVIISLPVIRFMGGGTLYLRSSPFTRARMDSQHAKAIIPLLKAQPYIEKVELFRGENCDMDLDNFRKLYFAALRKSLAAYRSTSLAYWYAKTFSVPIEEWKNPWLSCGPIPHPDSDDILPVTVNRTQRYRNPDFPWSRVLGHYQGKIQQIGDTSDERLQKVDMLYTQDLLDATQIIDASKLFIGNQSCCFHIAVGLGKPAVLEVFPPMPNCVYDRPNIVYGWDDSVVLPEI